MNIFPCVYKSCGTSSNNVLTYRSIKCWIWGFIYFFIMYNLVSIFNKYRCHFFCSPHRKPPVHLLKCFGSAIFSYKKPMGLIWARLKEDLRYPKLHTPYYFMQFTSSRRCHVSFPKLKTSPLNIFYVRVNIVTNRATTLIVVWNKVVEKYEVFLYLTTAFFFTKPWFWISNFNSLKYICKFPWNIYCKRRYFYMKVTASLKFVIYILISN